jgi:hypothetical protein
MRKTIEFDLFGNMYRLKEFAAADGVEILCAADGNPSHPLVVLQCCDVWTGEQWIPLDNRHNVNTLVTDAMKMTQPAQVLDQLIARIYQFNFDFLQGWKPINVPRRLMADLPKDIEAPRIDPVISLIAMADKATMRELEEYYSTRDAFKMYDMIAVDSLNKALGTEAAVAEAKSKARRH